MPDDEDPDLPDISEEDRQRIVSALLRMLELGMAGIYGTEDEGVPDTIVDCESMLGRCHAVCCTQTFALTKEEVDRGIVQYGRQRPFFIARDPDGYCPHLDRESLRCTVWNDRPIRCRRYNCAGDPQAPMQGGEGNGRY